MSSPVSHPFPDATSPVVLVTGGARRLGAEFCRAFAAAGWRVVIHCRRSLTEGQALAEELGGREKARVLPGDLLACAPEEVVERAASCFGRLDGLVNNASSYRRRGLLEATSQEWEEDFRLNFQVPFALMRAFARRGVPGAILNLLDGRWEKEDPSCAAYLLAKKTLGEATRLCAFAWGKLGIRVNGLAPGLVRPPEGVPLAAMEPLLAKLPLSRRVTEPELAKAALLLMETPSLTGVILPVDGGMHLHGMPMREKENPQ
ncbi:MAG: SDR family oxidoreductase [Oligosphaeraceae bacterium]